MEWDGSNEFSSIYIIKIQLINLSNQAYNNKN